MFSLVLVVAITVGYVARRSELAGQRDVSLANAAELGAARLASIVDNVQVAADVGVDPDETAASIAAANPRLGVCAVSAAATACAGDGPQPDSSMLDDMERQRASASDSVAGDTAQGVERAVASITVYDSMLTFDVDGPHLSVIARAPVDVVSDRSGVPVWATTFLPAGASVGEFAVESGLRQTATLVPGTPGLFVVASVDDGVELRGDEQRFYVIIFLLALALMGLAGITIFVEQRNLHERASFDALTKLPNRSEFERRAVEVLEDAERRGRTTCLLLFDLNGFKLVNDTYGHNAGDEMLRVVGTRLRKAVRDTDVVARWGGDEFVVMMPGIDSEEMGARRARQLADQISGRTRLEGVAEPLRVKVSAGVALWPGHGQDLDTLVEAADQAMYRAKREGVVCMIAEEPPEAPTPPQPYTVNA